MNPAGTGKPSEKQLAAWRAAGLKGAEASKIHGHTANKGSLTYRSWSKMIQRCRNPQNDRWKDYGGRGIQVCARWQTFEHFLSDMGVRPPGKSLDRYPNKDGNYEPGNTRWATPKEQSNNTRNNIVLTFLGKTQTISEWAEELGMAKTVLMSRYQRGWPIPKLFGIVKPRKKVNIS